MYRQFFGLDDEPFRLTPDPRYLFPSAKHAEALAHLRLGLTESSGFVCITGDVGTGKTTLLRVFLAELGPDVTAAYALTPPLSASDLLRRICREFGVPAQGKSQVPDDRRVRPLVTGRDALELPSLDRLLDHIGIVRAGFGDGDGDDEHSRRPHLARADRGAQVRRLDEAREAELASRAAGESGERLLEVTVPADPTRGALVPLEGDLLEALHTHLLAQNAAGRVSVVVLDEAQALSVDLLEQIRLLLNLETETQKLLRIVLVGQPQLRKLLLDPELAQLNQRITLRWHLGPLSYRETVAYVRHRLAVASGGHAADLFTRPALHLLHGVSGGVPRLINMLAHRALLAAYVVREPRVGRHLVARAYHEIQAVPLPGTLTRARKAAIATAGLAIGVALAVFGAPGLDRLLPGPLSAAAPESRSRPVPPAGDDQAPPSAAAAPDPTPAVPAPPTPPAAVAAPAVASAAEFARRLAGIEAQASARAATATLLAAWGERPLDPEETRLPDDLEAVAWRRRLQELQLTTNRSMLRLLDLPALLAVRVADAEGLRYVALTGMNDAQLVLSIDGASVTVAPDLLERSWTGEARVLWRDVDGLNETLRRGARGIAVVHLQEFLQRGGAYGGEITGMFDADTTRAVVDFQRSHRLSADGLVGPLTRIVLYATGGGPARPRLAIPTGTAS